MKIKLEWAVYSGPKMNFRMKTLEMRGYSIGKWSYLRAEYCAAEVLTCPFLVIVEHHEMRNAYNNVMPRNSRNCWYKGMSMIKRTIQKEFYFYFTYSFSSGVVNKAV